MPVAAKQQILKSKVVIRRLPPTLPEDVFWKSTAAWISDRSCLWKHFVPGRTDDRTVYSRAYILFSSPDELVNFHKGFDGHVFRSKAGIEYQAVVEFSPVQKTPYKTKAKNDARQGTIDDDADYKSFLESLNAPPVEAQPPPKNITHTTPLLDHLRSKPKPQKQKKPKDEMIRKAGPNTKAPSDQTSQQKYVAGKGREVTITEAESTTKAKGKKPKKKAPSQPVAEAPGAAITPKSQDRGRKGKKGGGPGGGAVEASGGGNGTVKVLPRSTHNNKNALGPSQSRIDM